jgi:hypothetical protein
MRPRAHLLENATPTAVKNIPCQKGVGNLLLADLMRNAATAQTNSTCSEIIAVLRLRADNSRIAGSPGGITVGKNKFS